MALGQITSENALGVVFAVQKFHNYLYGKESSSLNQTTNPYPLYSIVAKPCHQLLSQKSLIRCTITLSAYNFTIGHKPGRDLANADARVIYLNQKPQTKIVCLENL